MSKDFEQKLKKMAAENHEIELDLDLHEAIRRGMTDIKVPEK